MQESYKRVQWVYESTNDKELEDRYDQWAADYDNDLAAEFAWNAPQNATAVFAKHVDKSANVLDAGAGTGLVGECLAEAGYKDLVAMDLSQGMLDVAKSKNLYNAFHRMTLGGTLDFATDEFDAVISVGVFTVGHAPPALSTSWCGLPSRAATSCSASGSMSMKTAGSKRCRKVWRRQENGNLPS